DVIHAGTEQRVWLRRVGLKVQADVVATPSVRSISGRNNIKVGDETEGCPFDTRREGASVEIPDITDLRDPHIGRRAVQFLRLLWHRIEFFLQTGLRGCSSCQDGSCDQGRREQKKFGSQTSSQTLQSSSHSDRSPFFKSIRDWEGAEGTAKQPTPPPRHAGESCFDSGSNGRSCRRTHGKAHSQT